MTAANPLDRDRKNHLHAALTSLRNRIERIDGPYGKTTVALHELAQLYDAVIDDERLGDCIGCDDPIWASDTGGGRTEDGDHFCRSCAERWKAEADQ